MLKRLLHKMNNIKLNAKVLFYLFIGANLLPVFFLFFSEPYNSVGKLLLLILPFGFFTSLLSLHKRVGLMQLFLLPFFFFHAFQLVVFTLFKEDVIAVDMFLNLATTNASEAGELLGSILLPTIIICAIYIAIIFITILSFRKKETYSPSFLKKNLGIGLTSLFISLPLLLFAKDVNTNRFTIYEDIYPANVLYNMGFAINKLNKIHNYTKTSQDFSFHASKEQLSTQREIYILIIGETSRADNWSLYGYNRPTNPLLSNDTSVIHFNDALTQSNTTHKSVSILLSAASAENYNCIYSQKSLIESFKESGFTTVFLSNQAKNNSFIEYFGKEADYLEYYRSGHTNTNHFDEILLTRLQHYIQSVPNNLLVVMHTYGSHFNYSERYPKKYAHFTPDKFPSIDKTNRSNMINAYDNSILYTDYFLHSIGQIVDQSNSCASYLFISDHGEDIMDDDRERFLHASPNPTYYQLRVPLITWFSSGYQQTYPTKYKTAKKNCNKPVSSNMVFHTFLDIANIKTKYLKQENSFVNEQFQISKRMYLGDHDNPIPFYQTNLKKQDKIMFLKNGLSLD